MGRVIFTSMATAAFQKTYSGEKFLFPGSRKGFSKGHGEARLMYHDGVGGEKDKTAARSWFEKTLEAGDTEAAAKPCGLLAQCVSVTKLV